MYLEGIGDICVETIPNGLRPSCFGGRANAKTLTQAHAINADAVGNILGYINTQTNTPAQVWCCGVGRKNSNTLFIVIPVEIIRRAAQSSIASLIWDDAKKNEKAGRIADKKIPRLMPSGLSTALTGLQRIGVKTETLLSGVARVKYSALAKGRNNTRSTAAEKLAEEWLKSFECVDASRTRWTGENNGGGYDYKTGGGRQAQMHYNADIHLVFQDGTTANLECKNQYARMICPKNARAEYGLE